MPKPSPTAAADFKARVKRNVTDNFDQSCRKYQAFEDKHLLFYTLTLKLAECIQLQRETSVMDVGCGNGISARALNDHFDCRILGVDLSEKMVAAGRELCPEPEIELVVGDGEHLVELAAGRQFDYVLYNMALFIFPDVDCTLAEAGTCLRPGGKIAYSFYPELLGSGGEDLLALAFDRLGEPLPRFKVMTDYERAGQALERVCGNIRHHLWERPLDLAFLMDFFSIPAQSASLFPGLDYEDRLEKVTALMVTLDDEEGSGKVVWRMAEGTKVSTEL